LFMELRKIEEEFEIIQKALRNNSSRKPEQTLRKLTVLDIMQDYI
jgi:hypothetical protein